MLYPLIGPRLHRWLDDVVVVVFLLGAFAFSDYGGRRA